MHGSKVMDMRKVSKYAYLGELQVPITFEPYMIEPWILVLYLCSHGLRTQLIQQKCYWTDSLGCRPK